MKLKDKRIAILVTNGFEQSELEEPLKALQEEGGKVDLISPEEGKVRAWNKGEWGKEFSVDKTLSQADPSDYDGLVLPGGVLNPDQLRKDENAVAFIKEFFKGDRNKPVAAICHGPWSLIDAEVVKGRKMTSYESLRKDLENAGAEWVDEEVVVDHGLVTSRKPNDLPAFNRKMVEEFCEGSHRV